MDSFNFFAPNRRSGLLNCFPSRIGHVDRDWRLSWGFLEKLNRRCASAGLAPVAVASGALLPSMSTTFFPNYRRLVMSEDG